MRGACVGDEKCIQNFGHTLEGKIAFGTPDTVGG
jgi:hypothetical protein